jgi:predicted nucleotidyltransferase
MGSHLEDCRNFLRRRETQRQQRLDRRFQQAWSEAREIIALLVARYRPARIYQWGSLLDRRRFWERSDIDIAVEGIVAPDAFFAMYGDADQLTSFPLDLVALEKIEPEFAEIIRTEGTLVYERDNEDSNTFE